MISGFKHCGGLFLQVSIALVVMAAAASVDMEWTVALSRYEAPKLIAFMGDSIFEGESPGANDLVLFFLLGAAAIYYTGWRRPKVKAVAAWRPQTGFILTSALVSGLFLVHSMKWIMGRARPYMVLEQKAVYSHWFTFGPLFVTDGVFHGAFPSGHTAQTLLLMSVAFVLAGDPLAGKPVRLAGWIWGGVCVILSSIMGLTRCMTLSHWLTDVLGAIFMGTITMYLLYYKVLRVPEQRRFWARHGQLPFLPQAWELILSFYLFIGTIGLMMAVIGTRALWIRQGPLLALMVPVGALLIWIAWKQTAAMLHQVRQAVTLTPRTAPSHRSESNHGRRPVS